MIREDYTGRHFRWLPFRELLTQWFSIDLGRLYS